MENAVEANVDFYEPDSRPFGLTYGQWTVEWWRWFLRTPKSVNPILDNSGEFASVNQPEEKVWFLGGKLGDELASFPTRFCRIPSTRSILFPVINCEVNALECPALVTEEDLKTKVVSDENTILRKVCTVNGIVVQPQRIKSDPEIFEVSLDKDNPYDVAGGGVTLAAADGYWVFLKPLPVGEHDISFRGSCEFGRLHSGADYIVRIT